MQVIVPAFCVLSNLQKLLYMCTDIPCTREQVRDLIMQAIDGKIAGFWHIGYVNDCKQAANKYAHHYCTNEGADCMGIYMNE